MPPLYRRYIPPKPGQVVEAQAAAPVVAANTNGDNPEKKRKRERTDEEVAQRKAKKLDKKSNDGKTSLSEEAVRAPAKQKSTQVAQTALIEEPKDVPQANGDFAHIKNVKKRHKLEKEARKARRAAERSEKQEGEGGNDRAERGSIRAKLEDGEPAAEVLLATEDTKEDETADNEAHTRSALQQDETMTPGPKKRRHKLETILNGTTKSNGAALDSQDDEQHLRKHAGVLDKFQKATQARYEAQDAGLPVSAQEENVIVHDLVPLPQPAPRASTPAQPTYSALPKWLENPVSIPQQAPVPFAELGLNQGLVDHLSKLQFREALPVQQAAIPLLLKPGSAGAKYISGTESVVPDLAISAPTGSGKTLAYLLPIVESLKLKSGSGKLGALIVVPTRELVSQVSAIATSLAKGSKVTIGIASGSTKLSQEQDRLVRHSYAYVPEGYQRSIASIQRKSDISQHNEGETDTDFQAEEYEDTKNSKLQDLSMKAPPNHVPRFESAVSLLVCTPGRLIEHLKSTIGFSIAHLQWLVLDEADKLLDEQYDGFIELLQASLTRPRDRTEQDAREVYLRQSGHWDEVGERRVRKVLLSATMTHDISKLLDLQLRRPKLLVMQGSTAQPSTVGGAEQTKQLLELPPTLTEFCLPVGDGSDKPLHLVKLLESRVIPDNFLPAQKSSIKLNGKESENPGTETDTDSTSGDDSDSGSDTLSDSSSDVSSSDPSSDTDGSSDESDVPESSDIHPSRAALLARSAKPKSTSPPTILVFTSSNEAAMRLSRLLKLLRPAWAPWIATLAKASQKPPNLKPDQASLTICTDRAARGLDMIANRHITHVLQYDVPRSLESYVHRVGRTARAGRDGEAYTLYTHTQARWFLNQVARIPDVRRSSTVEKVDIPPIDEPLRKKFAKALDYMRGEAFG